MDTVSTAKSTVCNWRFGVFFPVSHTVFCFLLY